MNKLKCIKGILSLLLLLSVPALSQVYPYINWEKVYNAPSNLQDSSVSICMNPSGMVFVTGWSISPASNSDIVSLRYNPSNGDTVWVKRYVSNLEDKPAAMSCDNNAVYVTGWTFSPGPSRDVITIKFNAANGNIEWSKVYNGPRGGGDYGLAITNDAGFVYVTGRLSDTGSVEYQRFYVLKYNINTGNLESGFPYIYRGTPTNNEAHFILVDNGGNIYITGRSNYNPGPGDVLTQKISSSGNLLWSKIHNASGNGADDGISLAFDNSQTNLFVAGWGQRVNFSDYIIIKYNTSTGDSVAYASYNGIQGTDYLKGMVKDNSNNIYITGWSLNYNANRYEIATLKYNSNLAQLWVARTSNSEGWDLANSIALGSSNDVYVVGSRFRTGQGFNFFTIRYNASTGDTIWTVMKNGTANLNDHGSGVVTNDSHAVFASGSIVVSPATTASIYTVRYSNEIIGINPISSEIPEKFRLYQNFPNPFNPVTNIRFDLPKSSIVKLIIIDVTGRVVETIASDLSLTAGKYEVNWDASSYSSGIYFYYISAGNYHDTKKLVLLK